MSHYRNTLSFGVIALTSLVACSSSGKHSTNTTNTTSTRETMPVTDTGSTGTDARAAENRTADGTDLANNTAVNTRDRGGNTMTADRQTEGTRSDVEITRQIRQEIVKDDSLSSSAKNVKIITKNGVVNLRGPVANPTERSKIAAIAQSCAGVTNVRNSLEVKKQ